MTSKLSFATIAFWRPSPKFFLVNVLQLLTRRAPMKVLAIGSIVKPVSDEGRKAVMPKEVPATLKHYLDGKIEQFWSRQDAVGVIFLMNADSVEQAKAEVDTLP